MHRVLDLAILICRTELHFRDAYRFPNLYDETKPELERIGLQGDAMTVSICTDNPMITDDLKLLRDALVKDEEILAERFQTLGKLIQQGNF